jgi:hypothetical protein
MLFYEFGITYKRYCVDYDITFVQEKSKPKLKIQHEMEGDNK